MHEPARFATTAVSLPPASERLNIANSGTAPNRPQRRSARRERRRLLFHRRSDAGAELLARDDRETSRCPAGLPGRRGDLQWALVGAGVSGGRVHVAPEGVDAGVPLIGRLLEGLVGFLFHDLEAGAGDQLGDGAAELGAAGGVEPAGEHEGRC
jgi:hypothetical protein